jgi:2-dehydropantoate 2-reductase
MASAQTQCSIVGQGAIGLLAASRLQQAGWAVELWLRQAAPLTVEFQPLQGQTQNLNFNACLQPAKLLLIPVKAYAALPCLQQLQPLLRPDTQIVISHNGMPDLTTLQRHVTANQGLWFLSTSQAALRTATGVRHTGAGSSVLAPLNNAARNSGTEVESWLDTALGPLTITDDIQPALWRKLAINAAINPLTAIYGINNGALAAVEFQPQLEAIISEVCVLAAAEGIQLRLSETLQQVQQVIAATAANYSSMLQDVRAGRRTELSAITGYIVNTAARHHVAVPANQALWQALSSSA